MDNKIIDANVKGIITKEVIDGNTFYRLDGKLHCDFGPAVIYKNGLRCWYEHGVYHRIGGPAVIYPNGDEQYWILGVQYTKEKYYQKLEEPQVEEIPVEEPEIDSATNPKMDKTPEPGRRKLTISQIENLLGYRIRLISD